MSAAFSCVPEMSKPRAAIFGCAGPMLAPDERAFFRTEDPLGFILFQRNCVEPEQLRRLVVDLRDSIGRRDAPGPIHQEGGGGGPPRPPPRPPLSPPGARRRTPPPPPPRGP